MQIPSNGCPLPENVMVKVRSKTAGGSSQCVCRTERVAGFAPQALPLTLDEFRVRANVCTAKLTWNTLMEQNTSEFVIEYSQDGIHFVPVGKVPALNISTGGKYAFEYDLKDDKNFFRLQMKDLDGSFTNSPIVMIAANCRSKITVSPNPASSEVMVKGLQTSDEVRILTVEGKLLQKVRSTGSIQKLQISNFLQGIYVLQVYSAGGQLKATFKLQKM